MRRAALGAAGPELAWAGHKDATRGTLRANAWSCQQLPGVLVRHCGHPTALRPYFVEGARGPLGAHSLLASAQLAAELDGYSWAQHGWSLADLDGDNQVWRAMLQGDGPAQLRQLIDRLAR